MGSQSLNSAETFLVDQNRAYYDDYVDTSVNRIQSNQSSYYYYFTENTTFDFNYENSTLSDNIGSLSDRLVYFMTILLVYVLLICGMFLMSIYAYRKRIGYNYNEFNSIQKPEKFQFQNKLSSNYKKIVKKQSKKTPNTQFSTEMEACKYDVDDSQNESSQPLLLENGWNKPNSTYSQKGGKTFERLVSFFVWPSPRNRSPNTEYATLYALRVHDRINEFNDKVDPLTRNFQMNEINI
jgi:hypothetical protein